MAVVDNAMPTTIRSMVHRRQRKGLRPHQGDRNHSRNRHRRHGGYRAEKWGKLSAAEKEAALYKFDKPVKEKKITQEMRQIAFDNYETTDDHGMVIVGTAVDQQGNPFFKVKNSWAYVLPTTVTTTSRVRSWSTKPCPLW